MDNTAGRFDNTLGPYETSSQRQMAMKSWRFSKFDRQELIHIDLELGDCKIKDLLKSKSEAAMLLYGVRKEETAFDRCITVVEIVVPNSWL